MTGSDCPMCHAPGATLVGTMYRQAPVRVTPRGDWRRDESIDTTDTFYCVACGHEWDEKRNILARIAGADRSWPT